MTRRSQLTNLTWQGKVYCPLNATFSSVRVLMITAEHIESLVECGTWQGEVYWPTWHDKAKYIFNLTWQGEVYWPTCHDKAKYIDLPDMTRRSILTYLTWQGEVYWPIWHEKAKYIDLPDMTRRSILTYLTWQGEYIDLPDMTRRSILIYLTWWTNWSTFSSDKGCSRNTESSSITFLIVNGISLFIYVLILEINYILLGIFLHIFKPDKLYVRVIS